MKNILISFFGSFFIVWGICSLCNVLYKEGVIIQKTFSIKAYRITCFVQEVLDDGTLSYARVYETSHYPTHPNIDRIGIRLDNGEEIIYNGPYIIEEIKAEQN